MKYLNFSHVCNVLSSMSLLTYPENVNYINRSWLTQRTYYGLENDLHFLGVWLVSVSDSIENTVHKAVDISEHLYPPVYAPLHSAVWRLTALYKNNVWVSALAKICRDMKFDEKDDTTRSHDTIRLRRWECVHGIGHGLLLDFFDGHPPCHSVQIDSLTPNIIKAVNTCYNNGIEEDEISGHVCAIGAWMSYRMLKRSIPICTIAKTACHHQRLDEAIHGELTMDSAVNVVKSCWNSSYIKNEQDECVAASGQAVYSRLVSKPRIQEYCSYINATTYSNWEACVAGCAFAVTPPDPFAARISEHTETLNLFNYCNGLKGNLQTICMSSGLHWSGFYKTRALQIVETQRHSQYQQS